jgi:hypothetical protein
MNVREKKLRLKLNSIKS